MGNAKAKTVSDTSSARDKVLAALAVDHLEERVLKAKNIALMAMFPKIGKDTWEELRPDEDHLILDFLASKEVEEAAGLEVLAARLALHTRAESKRYLLTSSRDTAVDLRIQDPRGTLVVKDPTASVVNAMAAIAKEEPEDTTMTLSFEGISATDAKALLKAAAKISGVLALSGLSKEPKEFLAEHGASEWKKTAASRIAKECKIPECVV